MILLDSNILIYSATEQFKTLRDIIKNPDTACSLISKLEVLGYHKITSEQVIYFETVFKLVDIIPISDEIVTQAIKYRQKNNMSVGDVLIAATAKVFDCTLYTHNVEDFKNIKDIKVFDPIKL